MSIAVQCVECPSFYAIQNSTGFSDDCKNLMKNLEKQILEMCEPLTIKLPLVKAKKSLKEVYKEC